jgi:transcriptional regulator with XRE-family HTH domain
MHGIEHHGRTLREVGELLRDWRQRRHLTQRELAAAAGISGQLLGAIETGRELPSQDAILCLAEQLEVPLRDRNLILTAGGYAAVFPQRYLGDPVLANIWGMVEQMVRNHDPFPALALDQRWGIVASNGVLRRLIRGIDPALLSTPINWARVVLHPAGLAPRITNLAAWHGYVMSRLRRHFEQNADAAVADLLEEIGDYPVPKSGSQVGSDGVAVPLCLMTVDGLLTFYGATTVFGSAVDVTLAELAVETLHPANPETAAIMRHHAARPTADD